MDLKKVDPQFPFFVLTGIVFDSNYFNLAKFKNNQKL